MEHQHRRLLIHAAIAFLVLLGGITPAKAATRTWNFRVYLDDKPIGFQRFSVDDNNGDSTVAISARFEVKLLSFTVYRYAHDASEQWRSDCLQNLSAQTDDNGEQLAVSTELSSTGLVAIGKQGRVALGECPMSFAYWNPRMLQQSQLLNSQTGEYQRVVIREIGTEKLQVRETAMLARRYRIAGLKKPIDVWYSDAGEWLALEADVAGGRKLRYRLESPALVSDIAPPHQPDR